MSAAFPEQSEGKSASPFTPSLPPECGKAIQQDYDGKDYGTFLASRKPKRSGELSGV